MTFTSGFELQVLLTLRDVIAVSLKSPIQIPAMLFSVCYVQILCVCADVAIRLKVFCSVLKDL
jgi:hypothetical protein